MSLADAERLRSIKTFPSLVKYLRDDLDWPIASDDFDDLTFEYDPDELGLDSTSAVKIKDVKQLRPLVANQPWGIFFVNFEPKRLPVVVLRRILRSLVVKKRQTANKSQQAAWRLHDLLFISAYGESDHRDITLANFSEDAEHGDLPTLKVLGWDDEDTVLHLAHAHKVLQQQLHWPKNPADVNAWRSMWSQAFTLKHRQVIRTSREMAVRMAELAAGIRKRANKVLTVESEKGPLRRLMAAFKEALIHDLSEDDFADMYAQTITYGLLSARVSRPAGLVADNLRDMVPVTNPFLQELLSQFLTVGGRKGKIDFDELGINDVVRELRNADMEAVLRDFGDKNPQEDPVVHFYELFLKEYDPKKRMQRGVFYTPRPVVSFIVRSIHEILQTEFGLEDGLASTVTWDEMVTKNAGLKIPVDTKPTDPFVVVLDPAVGTATFLVEVIETIHRALIAEWKKQGMSAVQQVTAWNSYVPKHLLPRLYGYELMMAPYAIAHMKVGLKLYETGYRFGSDERTRIYLTNALDPPAGHKKQREFEEWAPALAHESNAVNEIKRHQRFTVVVGNPPYSGVSSNMTESAQALVDAYKIVDGQPLNERKHWLQDDYVKFLRLGQTVIDATDIGLLGFITNHGFLDNPTFRGMRQSLLESFSRINVCDLHGSAKKTEVIPEDVADENVFDIQQGVAITIARRKVNLKRHVFHAELWGDRTKKYKLLQSRDVASIAWIELAPNSPYYFFVPKNVDFLEEYNSGWPVTDILPIHVNGVLTARDAFVIDFDDGPIKERIATFLDPTLRDAEVKQRLELSENYAWRVKDARRELRAHKDWAKSLTNILYRPFDIRRIIYDGAVVWRPRTEVMRHMLSGKNLGLCTNRQVNGGFRHVGVTREIINDCTLSTATKERTYLFPLWLIPPETPTTLFEQRTPEPNFSQDFLRAVSEALQLPQAGIHGLPKGLVPEDIFNYIYAVLHSPGYRNRYSNFLKIDFPRLPLTESPSLFSALARLGGELVDVHLFESPKVSDEAHTEFIGGKNPEVEKVSWSKKTVWIDKAQSIGFKGVTESVWNFYIGGYQVCEKWLKDRKGRTLSKSDIANYRKIIVAMSETIRLMEKIDEAIEQHGGWPLVGSVKKSP